ncbi:Na+/H+ antiporter subunit E, partial [Acinetobacter ursingii]
PHPFVSFMVFLSWLMLSGSVELSTLFLATLLAIIIPRLVRPFIARTPHIHWIPAIKLFFVVFWDIVISNFRVARMVLGPIDHLQPKWYRVPLETEHEEVNTLLAMIITTTPGTVSAGIDQERGDILVHALSSDNAELD